MWTLTICERPEARFKDLFGVTKGFLYPLVWSDAAWERLAPLTIVGRGQKVAALGAEENLIKKTSGRLYGVLTR